MMILTMIVNGCANKFKINKQSVLGFDQSYYQRWTSGVKGGGSGINIFLVLKSSVDLKEEDVQVEGIYFNEFYTTLKFYAPNKFQGFIKTKNNSTDSFETLKEMSSNNEFGRTVVEKTEIPFELKNDEAMISYKEKGIQKYFKIILEKKDMMSHPM